MRFHPKVHWSRVAPVLGLTLVAALAACSSSSPSSTSPVSPPSSISATTGPASSGTGSSAAAIAEIRTNWEKFFNSSTSNSERLALLQNGSQFSSAIASFSSNPLASAVTSTVSAVTLTSPTQASVTYDLVVAGTTQASGQKGMSVLQDGVWKVGDAAFCGLLQEGATALNIKVPAACSS
jgi:hypothetical protein